jgi:MFS family permease
MPADYRARYAAYVQVGAPLGGLLAAFVGGYVEPALGWRAVFVLSAAPALLVAAAAYRWLPESDVWTRHASRRWMSIEDFRALEAHRSIIVSLFIVLLVNSEAYWFAYSWMPAYLRITRGLGPAASGWLMMQMQYGGVFGYAVFGRLADRFGRRPVVSTFGILIAIGVLPPTILWGWANGKAWLIPASMIVAGGGTGLWAGVGPMVSEMLPTQVRNTVLGLLLNVTRGLQFFTPLLITFLSVRIGFGPTLAIGALFSMAGAVPVWTLPETRGRSLKELESR